MSPAYRVEWTASAIIHADDALAAIEALGLTDLNKFAASSEITVDTTAQHPCQMPDG